MSSKKDITAERDELRDVVDALVRSARLLISCHESMGLPSLDAADDAREAISRAEAVEAARLRAEPAEHAVAAAIRATRSGGGKGAAAPAWKYERIDGLPISQCVTEVCEPCACRVALVSTRRRDGGFFTARVDFDGFKHDCARQKARVGGAR